MRVFFFFFLKDILVLCERVRTWLNPTMTTLAHSPPTRSSTSCRSIKSFQQFSQISSCSQQHFWKQCKKSQWLHDYMADQSINQSINYEYSNTTFSSTSRSILAAHFIPLAQAWTKHKLSSCRSPSTTSPAISICFRMARWLGPTWILSTVRL